MTLECVVDAELFKKYCLEKCDNSCEKYTKCSDSYYEVIVCLIEKMQEDKSWILKESKCLDNFLDFIDKGRCIIHYNNGIKDEYEKLLLVLPEPFLGSLNSILSNDQHAIKKDIGGLVDDDFDLIEDSDVLKSKRNYLDIAASLSQRTIVSTKEDKKNVYAPKHTTGLSLRIECKDVCEMENKIRIE